ncbi:MAG: 30S ribosome-binding factor RbfA [Clostridiales bacterium]|nr:30S ribosome-binding factor RbfA [Clostridiales bacterium]
MSEIRMGRIEEEMKRVISNILANDLKDPRITSLLSVTGVEVSNDLKYANVFISVFDGKDNHESTIKLLNKMKGFVKKELAHKIKLRCIPELTFKLDNSITYGSHIDEILNKILPNEQE